jgi:hypothetical protein
MQQVSDLRRALVEIDGSLRETPEINHRASGDIAVLQEPFGEAGHRIARGFPDLARDDESGTGGDPLIIAELPPEIELDDAAPLISMEEAEKVRTRVSMHGVDALGWYITFHQKAYQWGIYLSADGIRFLADPVQGIFGSLNVGPRRRVELACHAILRHELMHFAVDYMAAQWELATGFCCFWPAIKLRDPKLGYAPLEEELANSYMLRGFRFPSQSLREPGAYKSLRKFVRIMPPGYRDAVSNVSRSSFDALLELQICEFEGYLERPYRTSFPDGFDHLSLYPSLRPIDWRYCPILLDTGRSAVPISLRIITSIKMIDESLRFKRSIQRMPPAVRRSWDRVKEKLHVSTQIPGLDFKPWERDVFSVRVNGSVRAHLRIIRETGECLADAIGSHANMGHG